MGERKATLEGNSCLHQEERITSDMCLGKLLPSLPLHSLSASSPWSHPSVCLSTHAKFRLCVFTAEVTLVYGMPDLLPDAQYLEEDKGRRDSP